MLYLLLPFTNSLEYIQRMSTLKFRNDAVVQIFRLFASQNASKVWQNPPFVLKANYAAMVMFPRPAMLNYVK